MVAMPKSPPKSNKRAEIIRSKKIANAVRSMNVILGQSVGTSEQTRNMDQECGYPDEVTPELITKMYDREGVAQRVVHVYPVETWKTSPSVYETEKPKSTPFEVAVAEIIDQFNVWSLLERADKLSGLLSFGVVLIGLDDNRKLHRPVQGVTDDTEGFVLTPRKSKPLKVTYIRVFSQRQVRIAELEEDSSSPRYGRPKKYAIQMMSPADALVSPASSQKETVVHWSRIIHLADNLQSSTFVGVPRLEPAFNRILDLLKVMGGSSEMFWKGGFPGLSFEVQPGLGDIDFDPEAFREQIDLYANGLQRILRTVGIKVNSLAPQCSDPTPQIKAAIDQICITINCPHRIFLGSESAHLASTQDQKTWSDRINGRRTQYAIPYIIRPFIRRLIMYGAIPFAPSFYVDWKDPEEVDPLVRAQAFEKIVNAIAQYVSSGMATLVPPIYFLTELLNLPLSTAETILAAALEESKKAEKLPLVQATDAIELQKQQAETAKIAAKNKPDKAGTSGTAPAGKSGPKTGSGKRRESKSVSTGQKGG